MNQNIKYEKLAQSIYQNLLEEDGITTEVKHNVNIQGKSSKHQIDVYWDYTFAGVNHKVAIECKNYSKKLSIGIIRNFFGVLKDIGNTEGIIVTTVGYQKGALEYAEYHGINLIILREPKSEDWNGHVKKLVTKVQAISNFTTDLFIQLDYEWCHKNFNSQQLKSIEIDFTGLNNTIWIYDQEGNKIKNLLQLQDEAPVNKEKLTNNQHFYEFKNGYCKSNNLGQIKIKGVHIKYDTTIDKSEYIYDIEQATKAIVKNIITGEMKFIKK